MCKKDYLVFGSLGILYKHTISPINKNAIFAIGHNIAVSYAHLRDTPQMSVLCIYK